MLKKINFYWVTLFLTCINFAICLYATDYYWTAATLTAPWSGRYRHESVVYDNKIWILGGDAYYYKNDVWYSSDGINWTQATTSAGWNERCGFAAVVFNNKIWVLGGRDWHGTKKNDVWYSSDGINWTQATAAAPWEARWLHQAVVFNGKIWVFGGIVGSESKNDVWCSSDGLNWIQVTSMSGWSARFGMRSVVFDGKIWISGGISRESPSYKSDVWYSPDGANWTQSTSGADWSGRTEHGFVAYDNKLFIFGGRNGNYSNNVLNDLWWSTDGINWTRDIVSAPWEPKTGIDGVVFSNKIFLTGGETGVAEGNFPPYYPDVWYAVPYLSISGHVYNPGGGGISGANVTLAGTNTQSTTSSLDGSYQFDGLAFEGSFNITVSNGNYTFLPHPISLNGIVSNAQDQNFTRNNANSATISWLSGLVNRATQDLLYPTGSSVCYSIMYTDADNDIPASGYPKLHILKAGSEITGSPFVMDYRSGSYDAGAIYTLTRTLNIKGNDYTYYFEAYDIYNASSIVPVIQAGPTISFAPALTATSEAGYITDFINPNLGNINTNFDYKVKYLDADNDAPASGYPKLHILKGESEISGSPFVMGESNPADTVYSDGKIYLFQKALPVGMDYSYFVEAYDVIGASCAVPLQQGPVVGVTVGGTIKSPTGGALAGVRLSLSGYTTETYYSDLNGNYVFLITSNTYTLTPSSYSYYSFSPESYTFSNITQSVTGQNFVRNNSSPTFTASAGYLNGINYQTALTTNTFVFSAIYRDAENDAPLDLNMKVHILKDGALVRTLNLLCDGGDYINGVTCSTSTVFNTIGRYAYYFEGTDIWGCNAELKDSTNLYFDITDIPPFNFTNASAQAPDGSSVISSKVILRWMANDALGGNITYSLYISQPQSSVPDWLSSGHRASTNMTLAHTGTDTSYSIEKLLPGKIFYWQVSAVNDRGGSSSSPIWSFKTIDAVSKAYNYPNPFSAGRENTNVVFDMPENGSAGIAIYSEFGEKIFETYMDNLIAGSNSYVYDGKDGNGKTLFSGTYVCIITKKYPGKESVDKCRLLIIK